MKRKIVICIIVVTAFLILVGITGEPKSPSGNYPEKTNLDEISGQEEPSVEISEYEENYSFILFDDAGRVTVYYPDNVTVYLDTGISTDSLPEELQERLITGIRFTNEMELYEFLENYSS